MMKSSIITASDCNCSLTEAYLYFIYIVVDDIGYLYIGETTEKRGAMGRFAYHLQYDNKKNKGYSEGATFLKRLIEDDKAYFNDTNDIKDITMICYNLSCFGDFTGNLYKSNREAIEFLVQSEMRERSVDKTLRIPYSIISNVENNSYTNLDDYKKWANEICDDVMRILPFSEHSVEVSTL